MSLAIGGILKPISVRAFTGMYRDVPKRCTEAERYLP